MSERLAIHQLRGELELRERYWKAWNGRAANKMAMLEGENKDLQQRIEELEKAHLEAMEEWSKWAGRAKELRLLSIEPCSVITRSSRMCERGTTGCQVYHLREGRE